MSPGRADLRTLRGFALAGCAPLALGALNTGDVNATRSVTASDILGVKGRLGQAADGTRFPFDVDASGAIAAPDLGLAKVRPGVVVP